MNKMVQIPILVFGVCLKPMVKVKYVALTIACFVPVLLQDATELIYEGNQKARESPVVSDDQYHNTKEESLFSGLIQ